MKVKKSITIDYDIFEKVKELSILNKNNISMTICLLMRRVKDDNDNFVFDQVGSIKFME
jgi:hypothetical protein